MTDRDRADGVVRDTVGVFSGRGAPDRPFRELILAAPRTGKTIRVLTSLMDVPAYVIGILYRHRWQIELFFVLAPPTAEGAVLHVLVAAFQARHRKHVMDSGDH